MPLIGPVFLLFYSGVVVLDPLQIVMLVVFTAMIGFAEEALCRGMMVQAFLPRGVMRAAIFSSFTFGSMHLIQIFYGMNIFMALLYVLYVWALSRPAWKLLISSAKKRKINSKLVSAWDTSGRSPFPPGFLALCVRGSCRN